MLLAVVLAMVLVAAAPAIAQVGQGFSESRNKSGTASPSFSVSNKGNNVNLCPTGQQTAQTGNVLNEQGADQYRTKTDDIDFSGSEITVTPDTTAECTQEIRQAAAAAPAPAPAPAPAQAPAKAAPAPAPAKAAPAPAKELPPTGGLDIALAPLLGISAGVLLVAGGLLARRIIR
jgi:hypothetical protein